MSPREVGFPVCRLEDIADPGSFGFAVGTGDWPLRGFVVRRGAGVWAYRNVCPHAGHPLDWRPHAFLTADRKHIVCASHGAVFEFDTGRCIAGPCAGKALRRLAVRVEDGRVWVTPAASPDHSE